MSTAGSPGRTIGIVAVGALALAVAAYGAAHPSTWHWSLPQWNFGGLEPPPQPTESASPAPGFPTDTTPPPAWIPIALAILAGLVVLAILTLVVYRLVKAFLAVRIARMPAADQVDAGVGLAGARLTATQVADVVEEALARLDAAPTTTDAVIQAWLAFEEATARHGLVRGPAETATEFTEAVLERSAVPPADTEQLRTLYHRARFSDWVAGPDDVRRARAALEHIARTLEGRSTP